MVATAKELLTKKSPKFTFGDIIKGTKVDPRNYQQRITEKVTTLILEGGLKSVLINSPTGSGKTIMGLMIVKWLQKVLNCGVGWVAMRQNLLTQAQAANLEKEVGVDCLTTISMFDKDPPRFDAKGRPILILVCDEAQHDAASSMGHLYNLLQPVVILGLSATPYRTDKLKLCFQKVIRDAGIHQLMQQGYLARYNHFTIPRYDVPTVCERYLAEPERWGKSVFYWLKESLMMQCYSKLKAAGKRVAFVTGKQDQSEREDILARFDESRFGDGTKDGLDAIVNMFILTEGWDCTSLQTAWVRDSLQGPTVQMAGRAFRKHAGIERKNVVQSRHTKWTIEKTATPAHSLVWNDESSVTQEWRSVEPSLLSEEVARSALLTMAHIETKLPDFIIKKRGKRFARGGGNSYIDGNGNPDSGSGGSYRPIG